jgi:excisionase family DNA binding protein
MDTFEPLLSIREVARTLGISEAGVRRLIRTGAIVPTRIGGRVLFDPAEIRRTVKRAKQSPENESGPQ